MKVRTERGVILLALLLGSACSPSGASDAGTATNPRVARFSLPNLAEAEELEGRQPFEVTRSGDLTLGGKPLSGEQIASAFKERRDEGPSTARINVDPDAVHADVVARFAEVGQSGDYTLSDVKRYEEFSELGLIESGPAYRGDVGPNELSVAVGLASDGNACLATLNGKTLGHRELLDQSFRQLDTLVGRAGGYKTLLTKTNGGLDLVAHIQSEPRTPWRCVAGAIYAVQFAGWPVVQLEDIGE